MKTETEAGLQLFAGDEAACGQPEASADTAEETSLAAAENAPEGEKTASEAPQNEEKSAEMTETELLKAVKAAFEENEKYSRVNEVLGEWKKDAEELKRIYPGFEPADALKTPGMEQLLTAGVPLRRAFETLNLEKIIGSAMRYASLNAGKRTADALLRHGSRPQENGSLDRASTVKRTDVKSLTEKDIIKILGEVSRGAKISF